MFYSSLFNNIFMKVNQQLPPPEAESSLYLSNYYYSAYFLFLHGYHFFYFSFGNKSALHYCMLLLNVQQQMKRRILVSENWWKWTLAEIGIYNEIFNFLNLILYYVTIWVLNTFIPAWTGTPPFYSWSSYHPLVLKVSFSFVFICNPNPLPLMMLMLMLIKPTIRVSANDVKFIRENKSPEGKSVEFLDFGIYRKSLSFLCGKLMRVRPRFLMLDIVKSNERIEQLMKRYCLIGKLRIY